MREIYLAPFEAAVKKANAYGVMAAYNKVSGEWCSENDRLLNKSYAVNGDLRVSSFPTGEAPTPPQKLHWEVLM